ncbi:YkyA family protein [Bacillus sp. S/N-304-OC-R1]|uniref:YkyA family protein n=1 Tax=Bacillus sp. S/N-304-OC-R1 TaxID=2758034 RepID=UPI001C8E842F|nr:YkyA family protein [Bacillus sp. S/N-304-OC-R1]MBY0120869.1 YkyA family protein [Bacillus sp. S/N-304-OC-R1]
MPVFFRSLLLIFCLSIFTIISGCVSSTTPVEKVYEVLENVVAAEKVFEEQQDPLVDLEKKEKVVYEKIISLGLKEYDEISRLSDEATQIVDQRKAHMQKEEESIKASENEFKTIEPLIEEIDDPALKEMSQKLYNIMMERYSIHEELFENYAAAIELDKGLYAMFKQKDLQLTQLEEQITKINAAYGKIIEANKKFNEKTKQYNELKLSFYNESELDVKIDD